MLQQKRYQQMVSSFEDSGSVLDRHSRDSDEVKHSGRPTVRTEEVFSELRNRSKKACIVRLNTERYLEVLERFWEALNVTSKKQDWFQHDGASCHTSNDSLKWIKERSKSRVIS